MITEDFYGKNFVWWTGRVEDRVSDPLKMGMVRVRIFGLHADDEQLVPTSSLPWAQVINPPNSVKSFSVPRKGDWVFGFFQDGSSGQMPVVMGVYAGLESSESLKQDNQTNTTTIPSFGKSSSQNKTTTSTSSTQRLLNFQIPRPPSPDIIIREIEKPLNSRLSREILDGTMIQKMNQELTAACDITAIVEFNTAELKLAFSETMQAIRTAIREFLIGLGFGDPTGEVRWAIQQAKEIIADIKRITNMIIEVTEWLLLIPRIIKRIREFVDYIKTLPTQILSLAQNCLTSILTALTNGVLGFLEIPGLEEIGETIADIIDATTKLVNTFQNSVGTVIQAYQAIPADFQAMLESPTIPNLNLAARTHMQNFAASIPSPTQVINQSSFNSFQNRQRRGP